MCSIAGCAQVEKLLEYVLFINSRKSFLFTQKYKPRESLALNKLLK